MTGSVALDVVIGLVFIYLLYSLLATILMEIISNWIGLRARNLKYSIKRMLVDDEFTTHWFWKTKVTAYIRGIYLSLIDLIGIDPPQFKTRRKLFNDFYEQPSIKYLSHGGFFSKPSYLSGENFSKALIDTLKKNRNGQNTVSKIKNGINALARVNKETGNHIQSLLDDAQDDLERFKELLENWFDDTQARSIAWFKRNNQTWLLIIGFIMAVGMNADTISIANKLAVDPEARQQMVELAKASIDDNQKKLEDIQSRYAHREIPDSLSTKVDSILLARLDSLVAMKEMVQADISSAQNILGVNWNLPDKLKFYPSSTFRTDTLKNVIAIRKTLNISDTSTNEVKKQACYILADTTGLDLSILARSMNLDLTQEEASKGELRVDHWRYKRLYVFKNDSFDGFFSYLNPFNYFKFENLWGYLMTALAISLGAPFWFDLLNKLMKLRGSVQTASAPATVSTTDKNKKTPKRVG